MARNNKNDRKKQKRAEKKRLIRIQSASPYKQAGRFGEVEACYINAAWKSDGIASIHVLRRNPNGGFLLGRYLVDIFCLGLKAARVEKDYTMEEFRRNVLEGAPAEVELARRLVAGGIRFARVHHFKLPAHYDRYVSLLGDLGEIDAADVSDFGVNGKLRFIGELDELGRRLIGVSPKEFISRQDVEYIAMMGKSELGDSELRGNSDVESEFGKEAEDFFDAVAEAAEDIAAEVEEWCKANGRLPSPFLQNAAEVVLTSGYIAREEDSPRIDFNRRVTELINQSMESLPFYLRAEADSAVEQLQLFLSSKAATVVSDAKSQDKGRLRYVESDMYQK